MRENEIRPASMMAVREDLEAKDVQKVLAHASAFVKVACPACDSPRSEFSFAKKGFDFVTCTECQTLFVNPRPTSEMLAEHYCSSLMMAYWNEHIYPASEGVRREKIFVPRAQKTLDLCASHGVKRGRLVDVGAGYGTFCEEVQRLNYFEEVIALEPSSGLAQSCRERGVKVLEEFVENVQLQGGADVITNFELIEHLFCPRDFVQKCADLLSINGLLILTTPNIRGFDLRMLREVSDNIAAPNHINYFHPESLRILVESCGLEVVEILTPGQLDADIVHNKIVSGEFSVENNAFLQEIFVDRWSELGAPFQEFLSANRLSSHMWLVARKNG